MHVIQEFGDRVPPRPRKPKTPAASLTKAEVQRRYRANVQRRLRALADIQAILADLKESEE